MGPLTLYISKIPDGSEQSCSPLPWCHFIILRITSSYSSVFPNYANNSQNNEKIREGSCLKDEEAVHWSHHPSVFLITGNHPSACLQNEDSLRTFHFPPKMAMRRKPTVKTFTIIKWIKRWTQRGQHLRPRMMAKLTVKMKSQIMILNQFSQNQESVSEQNNVPEVW